MLTKHKSLHHHELLSSSIDVFRVYETLYIITYYPIKMSNLNMRESSEMTLLEIKTNSSN